MPWLAHGGGTGPDPEFFFLAGALAIVAIVLFVQKAASLLAIAALLLIAAALVVGAFALAPS